MSAVGAAGPHGLERRRTERAPMPARGGAVSVVGARLVNISSYGMMIESPVPLEREAVMQFRLVVAGEKTDVDARVAACTPVPGSRRYAVGLEFMRIAPEAQQRLIRVLGGQEAV